MIIANNINARNPEVGHWFHDLLAGGPTGEPAAKLKALARQCVSAGADVLEINLQQHDDRPPVMEAAVRMVQDAAGCQLCLSTNNAATLEAGLRACDRAPMINYLSLDEVRLKEMLPLAANYKAEVVLLVSDPARPTDARDMLHKAAVLEGAANEMGIPDERIIIDPGLIHVTHVLGQRHLLEIREFLKAMPDVLDPRLRSTCWLNNASAGAAPRLRSLIDTTVLATLSILGLSGAFMDVLSMEHMRMVRLLRMLDNERVYSDGEIDLALARR
ncbi:MAG: dihydropteroate synthase [Chloroflexi bacterium]|nr:dihydropteroate synthase [Chloroflexota bacterium]